MSPPFNTPDDTRPSTSSKLNKNSLLFLYTSPHTGHQKAAEAIMSAASTMDPRADCNGIDTADYAYPVISGVLLAL